MLFNSFFHNVVVAWGIILGSLAVYFILFYFLKQKVRKKEKELPRLLQDHVYYSGLVLVFVLTAMGVFPVFQEQFNPKVYDWAHHFLLILAIAGIGFLIIQLLAVFKEETFYRYKKRNTPDTAKYRKLSTQLHLIQRIANAIIIITTLAAIVMTFQNMKNMAAGILASAGILGIVLGFAAQKSLGTLFSGIQIAIAQPIRIGDVVVVENEFGTVGEINLTFVVIHKWDGRRLIVPINHFIEKTFESWTRVSPEVVCKVRIHADYTVPIEEVRAEFKRLLHATEFWDKRKSNFIVSAANDKTIELRATMSAKDSDDAWDLECYIREKLITYLQKNHSNALPQTRIVVNEWPPSSSGVS